MALSIKEKRKALSDYCDGFTTCSDGCKLFGITMSSDGCYTEDHTTDEEVERNYDIVFDESDPDAPVIKDSGDRTEFASGAVRDMHTGKGRLDLLPCSAILELAKHCENGALKYGERNVDKGIPQHSFIDSALRHLFKYLRGDRDENHLVAALWNVAWAVNQEVEKPEMQDIPSRMEHEGAPAREGDAVSRAAYNQVAWERDMAMQQLKSYGVGFCEDAAIARVKHGEWYLLDNCANAGVYCSVCHKKVYKENYANQKLKSPYCPNCGAKMDGTVSKTERVEEGDADA